MRTPLRLLSPLLLVACGGSNVVPDTWTATDTGTPATVTDDTATGDSGGTTDTTDTVDTTDTEDTTDSAVDTDGDDDGYHGTAYGGDDCDDSDPDVNPGATETWYDGVDSDCDGASDYDADGDGHDADDHDGDDCDDTDAKVTTECADSGSLLLHYTPDGDPWELTEIDSNLSGVTWNPDTGTYLIIRDGNRRVHEYSDAFVHLREITLDGLTQNDLEDISYLGLTADGPEYALVSEYGTMIIGVIPDDGGTEIDTTTWQTVTYSAEPAERNKGGEGVAYDPITETLWVCVEKDPMVVYTFARPAAGSDASYLDGLVVTEPFDAETMLGGDANDLSSCMYDPRTDQLLILSHESGVLLDVALDGTVLDELPVALHLTDADKPEGVTLNDDQALVIAGEPNEIRVYAYSGP